MAGLIQTYVEQWDTLVEKHKDDRVDGWLMMGSPLPGSLLVLSYLVIVWLGPRIMDKRKAFQLKETLIVYNFAMVLLSLYMVIQFGRGGWLNGYTLGCQLPEYDHSPRALVMLNVCWWFYFSKFIEMLDTIFFVLRKKRNQVSFLHVFHHASMPFTWWIGVKFSGGGAGTFHAFLNSFIHFVMYIYYGMAAIGPHMQKYLWWKKYMTRLQLLQFTVVLIHSSQFFIIDCAYPMIFTYIVGLYGFIFFVLFINFYIKSYLGAGRDHKEKNGSSHPISNGNGVKHESNGVTKMD